jgi:hypothetical protein
MHRARLERAFWSLPHMLDGDVDWAVHSLARLGVWATHLAKALDSSEVYSKEVAGQLRKLGEAGDIAFERWRASDGAGH